MVLFTKEVFMQLKSLNAMHIQCNPGVHYPGQPPGLPNWQIFVNGTTPSDPNNGMNGMDIAQGFVIQCASEEDARRIYKDLMQQVVDSGEVPKLNDKQFDEILNKEK